MLNPDSTTFATRTLAAVRIFSRQIGDNKKLFIIILIVGLLGLIPLYGILFPPMIDLAEHTLISKLLWEKLTGVSQLDIQVSWFLGYRLFPFLMVGIFEAADLIGIPFVYVPIIAAMFLILAYAAVIATVLYFCRDDWSWVSTGYAVCFALPVMACMYSAAWFLGLVNYTLAVTLLIPAIFFTERCLRFGKRADLILLAAALMLAYVAHPFSIAFWLLWCAARFISSIILRTFSVEWKQMGLCAIAALPVLLYHFIATAGSSLAPSGDSLTTVSPLLSASDWFQRRLFTLFNGTFLIADEETRSRFLGPVVGLLFVFSSVLSLRSERAAHLRNAGLAGILFFFMASWINEKFIPVPPGAWLAYEYRFSSAVYAICLVTAAVVLVRCLPVSTDGRLKKAVFAGLAAISLFGSLHHLFEIRAAYARFDVQARAYTAVFFNGEEPVGIALPRNPSHPDGRYLRHYICLIKSDCLSNNTTFAVFSYGGYAGDLFPLKMGRDQAGVGLGLELPADQNVPLAKAVILAPTPADSPAKMLTLESGLVGYWRLDEPDFGESLKDSSGKGIDAKATGTTVIQGKVGKARSFNGSSDHIDVPTVDIPNAITVSAWVYADNFVQSGHVVLKNPANTQWSLFFEYDGFLKWRSTTPTDTITCPAPEPGEWHHILATQDGVEAKLYIDGARCASGNISPIGNAPSSISFGWFDTISFNYYQGAIDEVRLYDRALSEKEVAKLATAR